MDSWKKVEETSLPPKNAYYSRLNIKGIADQDYEHAKQVWNRVTPEHENITLGDYHDVYLATYVFLLADIFETFRNACLEHYKLDNNNNNNNNNILFILGKKHVNTRVAAS